MNLIKIQEAISFEYNKRLENLVLTETEAILKTEFPEIKIDREKLKHWFLQEEHLHRMVEKKAYTDLYKSFRKELDEMCIPLILESVQRIEPIVADNEVVGMVAGNDKYIDCVYVKPNYRRKGLAKQAVLKFVEGKIDKGIRLEIINNNAVAFNFWCSIFELREIGSDYVDTLYEIVKIREGANE